MHTNYSIKASSTTLAKKGRRALIYAERPGRRKAGKTQFSFRLVIIRSNQITTDTRVRESVLTARNMTEWWWFDGKWRNNKTVNKQNGESDDKKIPMSCHQQQKQSLVVFLLSNFLRVFMFCSSTIFAPPARSRFASSLCLEKLDYISSHHPPPPLLENPNSSMRRERAETQQHSAHFPTSDGGMKSSPGNTHSKHIRLVKAQYFPSPFPSLQGDDSSTSPEGSVWKWRWLWWWSARCEKQKSSKIVKNYVL